MEREKPLTERVSYEPPKRYDTNTPEGREEFREMIRERLFSPAVLGYLDGLVRHG